MRQVYVNGALVPEQEATVPVFDRGYLFGDAVYEVTAVVGGRLVDFPAHMARLRRSLGAIDLPLGLTDAGLLAMHRELVRCNGLDEGLIYLQVSRPADDRDFLRPDPPREATVVAFTQNRPVTSPAAMAGIPVASFEDLRWQRSDIKSVQLLYATMVKTEAKARGCGDAWLVRDGLVTEGASNNVFIVDRDGVLRTRRLSREILAGITRKAVLGCIGRAGLAFEERPFSIAEACAAREAFITSATAFVTPVIAVDGQPIGDGQAGPVAWRLREEYLALARETAI